MKPTTSFSGVLNGLVTGSQDRHYGTKWVCRDHDPTGDTSSPGATLLIVRKVFAAVGALAVGIGVSACSSTPSGVSVPSSSEPGSASTTTLPGSPGAKDTSAVQTMKAALRHGASEPSLHYVITSAGNGITTTIVGNVDKRAGTQTVYVSGQAKGTMVIELVGQTAYFRGDAAAIEVLVGLTGPAAAAAAGRWISVVPGDAVYQSTAAALTVGSVMSEMALAPPVTGGHDSVVGGRRVVQVSGGWVGDGITAKNHATAKLVVTGDATSLPVSFSGVVPPTATTTRFVNTIVVSRWGEPVHVAPPGSSTPLSLIPGGVTTTTQPPTVV